VLPGPAKHWGGLDATNDPVAASKRLAPEVVDFVVAKTSAIPFAVTVEPASLGGDFTRKLDTFEKKLKAGEIQDQAETFRARALAAERHLLRLGHRDLDPEKAAEVVTQLINLVKGACDDAHNATKIGGTPFGARMLAEVQTRLRKLAEEQSSMVAGQKYECLAGVAGLLTGDCKVWWSPPFDVGASA
jgi:hypothetical protein